MFTSASHSNFRGKNATVSAPPAVDSPSPVAPGRPGENEKTTVQDMRCLFYLYFVYIYSMLYIYIMYMYVYIYIHTTYILRIIMYVYIIYTYVE